VVVGGGAVVTGGVVVVVAGSVVVGGPRRGPGADDGPDCDATCGGEVTGTDVVDGTTPGAGAEAVVVVVVDSSTVVGDGCDCGCCSVTGTTKGAAVVDGVSSTFAGAGCGRSTDASNATATRPAANARHTSDNAVVAICARPTGCG